VALAGMVGNVVTLDVCDRCSSADSGGQLTLRRGDDALCLPERGRLQRWARRRFLHKGVDSLQDSHDFRQ